MRSTEILDIEQVATEEHYHFVIGPVVATSDSTFHGICPPVSYCPSSLSSTEMLIGEMIQQITELINFLDATHLPYDPTHIISVQKDSKG